MQQIKRVSAFAGKAQEFAGECGSRNSDESAGEDCEQSERRDSSQATNKEDQRPE